MSSVGTASNPLRVAIIGSGPSGFYAAEALAKKADIQAQVDIFDRLPTPYGLVRGGVAPDHQKIKSVTRVYERIAALDNVRFFGNVEFGRDIFLADLQKQYHAVLFAVGSASDKHLGIPGEDLKGSFAATEFVGWYNGHPDYRHYDFELDKVESVAVVGVGNVAMDVTRILARSQAELMETDIADDALEALANSGVKKIYVLGRRGPAQAAFTNPEIKELGEMEDADIVVPLADATLDALSEAYLESDNADKKDIRNVEILKEYVNREPEGKPKQIIMRFLVSPVELIGTDRVEAVKIVKNELYEDDRGNLRPRATDQVETIPVDLIFRSVGYRGVELADVPFYDKWGTIPNIDGRIVAEFGSDDPVPGMYVAGWIKRGPSGIIGTNRADAVESVNSMLADVENGTFWSPTVTDPAAMVDLLKERNVRYVTWADWLRLDQLELERGQQSGRPRRKFTTIQAMLDALDEAKNAAPGD
ncbi:MAG: FAD-dependent oxidoreductase [Anaerolineaceae bacterium]|nr:FAD-dependent oxidoreductase [Anaerolineaceae bacterium]